MELVMRHRLPTVTSYLVAALALASPAAAQSPYVLDNVRPFVIRAGKSVSISEIYAALEQSVDSKIFKKEMPFKDFLKTLRDNLKDKGKDIGFVIDTEAFWVDNPDGPAAEDAMIVSLRTGKLHALTFIKAVLHTNFSTATYRVRKGYVEITTAAKAARFLEETLKPRTIDGRLDKVLEELAEETGISIVVDIRVQKQAESAVRAKFLNGVSIGAALHILTDMAELRYVAVENAVYVTSPANARKMEQRMQPQK
jgi:hypothetical protein